jgi:hypothetical protein
MLWRLTKSPGLHPGSAPMPRSLQDGLMAGGRGCATRSWSVTLYIGRTGLQMKCAALFIDRIFYDRSQQPHNDTKMRVSTLPAAFALFTLLNASPTLHTHLLSKRAPQVLSPVWGYSVTFPGNHTEITWTEPSTRDVRIALVRGLPGQVVEVGPYDSCKSL